MISSVVRRLKRFIEQDDWQGWDPYDALNSPFLRYITFNAKWPRIAAIQMLKRSPVNMRPLFGVPKKRHPKALGLLARAFLLQYQITKDERYLEDALTALTWLESHSVKGTNYAWGHSFDWQSSIFYVQEHVPTVVNTTFIAHAFLDAYRLTHKEHYLSIARSSCDFILKELHCTEQDGCFCFSYTPIDQARVHNANLLAADLLARVFSITKEECLCTAAEKSLKLSIQHQNEDGSWFYGIEPELHYIDSFHTGFVLVSIHNILRYLGFLNSEYEQNLLRGYQYYKGTFFDADGMPYYANNKRYPVDLHCTAQGIITCAELRAYDSNALTLARKLANWAIEHMWDEERGFFYFQKTKYFTNKTPYLRWPNVWMFYALTKFQSVSVTEYRRMGKLGTT